MNQLLADYDHVLDWYSSYLVGCQYQDYQQAADLRWLRAWSHELGAALLSL